MSHFFAKNLTLAHQKPRFMSVAEQKDDIDTSQSQPENAGGKVCVTT